jgi:hypothetical protein
MYTTYFDEYQKQFGEWQQKASEWQKQFSNNWLETLPNMKGEVNFVESFDKALAFQEELVKSYLDAQEKTTHMMLDAQKKFWQDYFTQVRQRQTENATN